MTAKNTRHRVSTSTRLPRRVTTVDDVLARDDVSQILDETNKAKPNIKAMIVIYMDKNDCPHWTMTDDTLVSTGVFMLEGMKLDLMNGNIEE